MEVQKLVHWLDEIGVDCFTGVPDSLLRPFCDYLMGRYGMSRQHIVAANEGAAVGLAAGHYLATGRPAVVYMQNSGIGNAVNPIASLLHEQVYRIPVIFIVGWRGEPGVKDEPQHVFQGQATLDMLDCLQIPHRILSKDTDEAEWKQICAEFDKVLQDGRSVALVVRKGALENPDKMQYRSDHKMTREQILEIVVQQSHPDDIFVCTTGKLSREMFEIRERNHTGHDRDFLTVGSMGHSVMIAMGIALEKPDRKVYCLDGDGAAIMHLGSQAVVGGYAPRNLVHLVVNNGAHETVGGIPNVAGKLNLAEVAKALGYAAAYRAETEEELVLALKKAAAAQGGPVFIEAKSNLQSRKDLGRPTTTPIQNKQALMKRLMGEKN